jgi:hypothetical protein
MKNIFELLRQNASSATTVLAGFTTGLVAVNTFCLYQNRQARQRSAEISAQREGVDNAVSSGQAPFQRHVLFSGNMAIDSIYVESTQAMAKPRPK